MNQSIKTNKEMRDAIYQTLKKEIKPLPGEDFLCQLLSSWLSECSALPHGLGMSEEDYQSFVKTYFHQFELPYHSPTGLTLDESRLPERAELEQFLSESQVNPTDSEKLLVKVLVAGLTGSNHLWEDMGFFSRKELSAFLMLFFKNMAEKNTQNMKWKKFIYKQLCLKEEIGYTCRSPSCEVCVDYSQCFDTEEGFWP